MAANSVDFDYSGSPVNVSNRMAVQLVSQFGIHNAWFAFLKLRGMKLKNEEAEKALQPFNYFRNKIGYLRQQVNQLDVKQEKAEELDELMSSDFDNFMTSPESLELRIDAPQYAEVDEKEVSEWNDNSLSASIIVTPTTDSLLKVIEQSKQQNVTSKDEIIIEKILPSTSQKETSDGGFQKSNKNTRERGDNPETKQVVEKLLAAKEEIARRHAETIDDVVSLVMEKIKNNQPFEGELSVGTNHGPPKSHHRRTGTGINQRMQRAGLNQRRADEMGVTEHEIMQAQQQAQTSGPPIITTQPLMATAHQAGGFSQLSPGQSFVLLHNSGASGTVQLPSYSASSLTTGHYPQPSSNVLPSDHVTILSKFPEMIRSTSGTATTMTSATAGLITASAQHQTLRGRSGQYPINMQPQLTGQFPAGDAEIGTTTAAIPIDMAIQQNMTVQELIQTLKTQSRHQNAAHIILHHNTSPMVATTLTPAQQHFQQETPDSSSQEAATFHEVKKLTTEKEVKTVASKKGRKRKASEDRQQPATKQKQQTQAMPFDGEKLETAVRTTNLEEVKEITAVKKTKYPLTGKKTRTPKEEPQKQTIISRVSDSQSIVNNKEQRKIEDIESQLHKTNKQLSTEKNKSAAQKKRAEKLQAELDKALDSIQLLQIDLACQKTDNNNLIAENIALKAENQQLRSKGISAAQRVASTPASTSSSTGRWRKKKEEIQEKEAHPKSKIGGRGRKPAVAAPATEEEQPPIRFPEKLQTPPPLSSELGRRQSKRICVTRNQFTKNLF